MQEKGKYCTNDEDKGFKRSFRFRVGKRSDQRKMIQQFSKTYPKSPLQLIEHINKNDKSERKRQKTTTIYYRPKGLFISAC